MEYLPSYKDSLYLEHHGVLGMKWGVRRYQNPDGSWKAAGNKHRREGSGSGLDAGGLFSKKSNPADHPNFDSTTGFIKKTNINSDIDADYNAVNPKYKKLGNAYKMNCTKCSVAYDLRRRGFDVHAGPSKRAIPEQVTDNFYKNAEKKLISSVGADGRPPITNRVTCKPNEARFYIMKAATMASKHPEEYSKLQKEHANKLVQSCESFGPGARGAINMNFTSGFGHCIAFENDKNGKVQFIDTQTAGIFEKKKGYSGYSDVNGEYYKKIIAGGINPYIPTSVSRYDNATPNYEYIKKMNVLEQG